jgi:AmmeMemoRadiSam system protein B
MTTRPAAVAGSWYPATAGALAREVDDYVEAAADAPDGEIRGIIAPHAGIMFSGPVGAYAYKAVAHGEYDVAVLVGPSHYAGFEGVASYPEGAFACPLGPLTIDAETAASIERASPTAGLVHPRPAVHAREHSLEMQLPFLRRLLPEVKIVPLLMGYQTRESIEGLARALVDGAGSRRVLLVASTDLSHYFDATTAARLDAQTRACVAAFDAARLLTHFERQPVGERGRQVGCGIGPAVSVMMAAQALGAREARVLKYAHSGDVSGDYSGVVGYLAAALGTFDAE